MCGVPVHVHVQGVRVLLLLRRGATAGTRGVEERPGRTRVPQIRRPTRTVTFPRDRPHALNARKDDGDIAIGCELDRIGQQIGDDLAYAERVASNVSAGLVQCMSFRLVI